MKTLTIDSECSGAQRNKAHWADKRNKMVLLTAIEDNNPVYAVRLEDTIEAELDELRDRFLTAEWVVGFNLPYDLLWMRRMGIDLVDKKLWDCQLYHFIANNQAVRYPSLNGVAEHWGLPLKLDVVKTQYWDVGIDTDAVPREILEEYGNYDTELTHKIAKLQMDEFKTLSKQLRRTILLAMQDMSVIVDMMWNGVLYDSARSARIADELETKSKLLVAGLQQAVQDGATQEIPIINWGSIDQVSAVLYGGTIKVETTEEYLFAYKDPKKPPVTKIRKVETLVELPRLVTPLKGSEMKKEGIFSTSDDTLKSLKAGQKAKKIIHMLCDLRATEKLIGTYFRGFLNKIEYYNWEDNIIHTQLSQVTAVTGRMASNGPNIQNLPPVQKQCLMSRFKRKGEDYATG